MADSQHAFKCLLNPSLLVHNRSVFFVYSVYFFTVKHDILYVITMLKFLLVLTVYTHNPSQ